MRMVSLLLVILPLSVVWAQEERKDNPPQERPKIPAAFEDHPVLKRMWSNIPPTLAEAHAELERMLPPQELAKIDAMPSEEGMIMYHFSLGLNMRNGWGLWAGSPLAKHMQELGFAHPDDMSGVILVTFWRKRHGQDLRLEELATAAKEPQKALQNVWEEEEKRVRKAKAAVRNMVMTAVLSVILLIGGLACLIRARISLYKQRARLFFSLGLMSKEYANLYKIAYVLMGVGVLVMLVLLNALRTVG